MKESYIWVFVIGFIGQLLFSTRILIQWFLSEKAGKSVSPAIFWELSILGSIVFLIYGILRKDLAIILGQCLVYYIYIRNLHFKNRWKMLPLLMRWIILTIPFFAVIYLFSNSPGNIFEAFNNIRIPFWLKVWGILGQIVFTSRFYFQWIDSELEKESILTKRFWLISATGALMIISYAVFRLDPVLFLGQTVGFVVYIRNLIILNGSKKIW